MAQHAVGPENECEGCQALDWQRVFESPMVASASLPDGTKRKGWADMKEAAKLECIKADLPQHKRGDVQKQINILKAVK